MSLIPDHEVRLTPADPSMRLTRIETALALLQAAIERIEHKVDALVMALADGDQEDDKGTDLMGNPLPRERDPHEPL